MDTRGSVLVVDDETYVRDSLAMLLTRNGYSAKTAGGCQEAMQTIAASETEAGGNRIDAVITDLKMPGASGSQLVKSISERSPSLPVIVLTAYGTIPSAVECVRLGAFDYLLKPASPDQLVAVLDKAIRAGAAPRAERTPPRPADAPRPSSTRREPLGVSPAWARVRELVELAAPADTSVLIVGESGTGKEEVARLLHASSPRASQAFVSVNCAAIPSELFESEFFGHRRGAFTGAVADRAGRFQVANGGTLFLDEVSSLPEAGQAKLLRVLEEGVFERVGESRSTSTDVRLICAGSADLPSLVAAGRFRTDLFYRINVVTIEVPPLRERREDIPVLASAFLAELGPRLGKGVDTIHPDALGLLTAYSWPGNVRELRNVIERGVLIEKTSTLMASSLPFGETAPALPGLNLRGALASEEKRVLAEALARADGVKRHAAQLLGIDERNLAYYLRKHDLMERER